MFGTRDLAGSRIEATADVARNALLNLSVREQVHVGAAQ